MCNVSTIKARHGGGIGAVAQPEGRPVLQTACNRVMSTIEAGRAVKKLLEKPIPSTLSPPLPVLSSPSAGDDADARCVIPSAATSPVVHTKASLSACPKPKAAAKTVHGRNDDPNGLNSSGEKSLSPKSNRRPAPALRKKSKKSGQASLSVPSDAVLSFFVGHDMAAKPGSIAAAQREQATLRQAQRKMRIAHYGRTPGKVMPINSASSDDAADSAAREEKRCSFITSNSDPIYVAYHDDEWGVPVHEDMMLFELLVLAGAQVGSDWTAILKKRENFRAAFAGFDAEVVATFNEKQIAAVSSEYGIDMGRVRSVVDNSYRILDVKKEFGSLDEYIWGFVNHQPISTRYSSCRKIPVKTSKSEAISKDMVRRGFRFAGPTVIHSFMQAAGLTNDHLLSCPRRGHLLQQFAPKDSNAPPLTSITSPATQ